MVETAIRVKTDVDISGLTSLRNEIASTASVVDAESMRMAGGFESAGYRGENAMIRMQLSLVTVRETLPSTTAGVREYIHALRRLGEESIRTEVKSLRLLTAMGTLSSASMSLWSSFDRLRSGEAGVIETMARMIPSIASLVAALWTVVPALWAKAAGWLAVHSAMAGVAAAIVAGIILGTIIAGVLTLEKIMPRRQLGGSIPFTGPVMMHAGEYVLPRGTAPININIYGAGKPKETEDAVVRGLRRAGVV